MIINQSKNQNQRGTPRMRFIEKSAFSRAGSLVSNNHKTQNTNDTRTNANVQGASPMDYRTRIHTEIALQGLPERHQRQKHNLHALRCTHVWRMQTLKTMPKTEYLKYPRKCNNCGCTMYEPNGTLHPFICKECEIKIKPQTK